MTEDTDPSQSRQRKKRKWDQPAPGLVSAGVVASGVVPLGNPGSLVGMTLPGVASGSLLTNPLVAGCAAVLPGLQVPSVPPKPNQPKIQDELIIAREIVINDADPSVRYKLTKRQTQEEIQKCTGAVVITRGKYRTPDAPADGEKPLYLHVSAAVHLKDTAERILAVDRAAAMVEEMLKQGQTLQPMAPIFQGTMGNGMKALSTSVFLGFDADPSLNITARIRGPNDQYINHIMNETGATVILKGRGSENHESFSGGEVQQPLHLFLSASNSKSLEDAKRLAENLLDTISLECGASRISSCKVYGAVPPPQQLLAGVESSGNEQKINSVQAIALPLLTTSSAPSTSASSVPPTTSFFSQGTLSVTGGTMSCELPQTNLVSHPQPLVTGGTSYNGYGGIYPQATPLQQVALALRQSPSPITSTVSHATSISNTEPKLSMNSISEKDKRPTQKRKFQELPVSLKDPARLHQGSELLKAVGVPSADTGMRNVSTVPAPKKSELSSNVMPPPPPPRTMPPPPPPPKFNSSTPSKLHDKGKVLNKIVSESVPDTLVKLMEYGEEDDDYEESSEEPFKGNGTLPVRKPFWAV
uniref:Protein RIK n=2 Tax=Rhizophora mucronata TaxID=61149 RepID=A0A2P2LTF2_RHIMU